ncbi:MAG: universal stress protein [Chloroflexi bacterium]|nr:universal stress protein [Chloroflexota bacterium]MCA2000815.1 universal stress protein [Chloroflexota bacterium]
MYKKILVPLDGTPLAEAALPHAQALAKSEGAELVLLRVAVTPDPNFYHRDEGECRMISDSIKKEALEYMETEVSKLRKEGVKVAVLMRDGSIPDAIVEAAEETHADVIAMSTHGRVGVQRLLKGSVAEEVVHASRIPVLLIHPN